MRRWSREKIRRNQSGLQRDSVHSQQNQSLRISSFVKAPKSQTEEDHESEEEEETSQFNKCPAQMLKLRNAVT